MFEGHLIGEVGIYLPTYVPCNTFLEGDIVFQCYSYRSNFEFAIYSFRGIIRNLTFFTMRELMFNSNLDTAGRRLLEMQKHPQKRIISKHRTVSTRFEPGTHKTIVH